MLTLYTDEHRLQDGQAELIDGKLLPCFEMPRRADMILASVREVGLGEVQAPDPHGPEPLARVHSLPFLRFLESAWDEWVKAHGEYDALPLVWPTRGFRHIEPLAIDGKLSYFSLDAGTPITAGTWRAARAAADVALTGADRIGQGARAAFSLCRPPGHHASSDVYGGYCFLNNAAIATQALLESGAARAAILDVDYHHGNGTQSIFYARGDVLFALLHAHPEQEFPYFLGYEDEQGEGEGEGCNLNYPLRWGSAWNVWGAALDDACRRIQQFAPDVLVVSLGVDTFEGDPISRFLLRGEDYPRMGERIAELARTRDIPVLFVMEGGYAVEAIGVNAVNVLAGFEQAR